MKTNEVIANDADPFVLLVMKNDHIDFLADYFVLAYSYLLIYRQNIFKAWFLSRQLTL
jgi:hypothetical protein